MFRTLFDDSLIITDNGYEMVRDHVKDWIGFAGEDSYVPEEDTDQKLLNDSFEPILQDAARRANDCY